MMVVVVVMERKTHRKEDPGQIERPRHWNPSHDGQDAQDAPTLVAKVVVVVIVVCISISETK